MSRITMRVRFGYLCAVGVIVALALLVASCGGAGGGSASGSGTTSTQAAVLDTGKAIEGSIVATDGGAIDLNTDEATVRVVFPQEALEKDASLVLTPLAKAPGAAEGMVVKGFDLVEKGTGAGPKLRYPVWIVMSVDKALGDDVGIVSYRPDGTFEVVPTKVATGKNGTVLTGLVTHFSPVGGRRLTPAQVKARDNFGDFNWVIYVKGTQKLQNGPMKQTLTLNLRAVNKGGDIDGDYEGNATMRSTNEMSAGGGSAKAVFTGKSESVSLKIIVGTLAPLTAPPTTSEGFPLKPLSPDPDWSGGGTIKMAAMSASGVGTVKAGGYGASKGLSNTSSIPVTITMWGPQLVLEAAFESGTASFRGFVRGEGKK